MGERLMPLALGTCSSPEALSQLRTWSSRVAVPGLPRSPEAAIAGLYLYFSCRDEAHEAAQSISVGRGRLLAWRCASSGAGPGQRALLVSTSPVTSYFHRFDGRRAGYRRARWRVGSGSFRRNLRKRAPPARLAVGTDGARDAARRVAAAFRLLRLQGERRALKKLAILLTIVAVAATLWFYGRKPELPAVPFAKAMRETLTSTLPTNGKVEPLEWSTARAESAGIVDRVTTQLGQAVQQGAVIATLRFTGPQPDVAAAQAQIAQAKAQLAEIAHGGQNAALADIENALQLANFQKKEAQMDLDLLIRLEKKKAATPAEVVAARKKVSEAQIEIDATKTQARGADRRGRSLRRRGGAEGRRGSRGSRKETAGPIRDSLPTFRDRL